MLEWKEQSDGRTALLIEGARRIGKSTIAEEFAKKEYKDYILIDFSNASHEVVDLFNYVYDLDYFFLRLNTLYRRKLPERKSVIIFDEVQFCPKARQAIKHLVEDGRYDYIETGSLISIRKNIKDILIPSEEHRIPMYPMDYEEYLWAIGKETTFNFIKYSFDNQKPLGESANRQLMTEFRQYLLIGGMPQSIAAFIRTNDFSAVDRVKREILDLYEEDFRKIDSTGKATSIFTSIPAQLSRNTLNYNVGNVFPDSRPSRLVEVFNDVRESRTVNFAYNANDPGVGFALNADYDNFKMYLADTGLFISLVFRDNDYTENDIYKKMLLDKLPANLGFIYENAVAQMLKSSGHSLYYYSFKERREEESKVNTYEIDFLISKKGKICPIEVKSSGYKAHKSLDMFKKKYSSRIGKSYLLYTKDVRRDEDIICLPIYMACLL